jgi:Stress responsive A/B Barrel Domain
LEYANDPAHVKVVKECVLPICDDIMAVDWVAEGLVPGPVAPGSAIRLTLAKLKEGNLPFICYCYMLTLFDCQISLYYVMLEE